MAGLRRQREKRWGLSGIALTVSSDVPFSWMEPPWALMMAVMKMWRFY